MTYKQACPKLIQLDVGAISWAPYSSYLGKGKGGGKGNNSSNPKLSCSPCDFQLYIIHRRDWGDQPWISMLHPSQLGMDKARSPPFPHAAKEPFIAAAASNLRIGEPSEGEQQARALTRCGVLHTSLVHYSPPPHNLLFDTSSFSQPHGRGWRCPPASSGTTPLLCKGQDLARGLLVANPKSSAFSIYGVDSSVGLTEDHKGGMKYF